MNNYLRKIIFLVASAQMHSDEGKIERNANSWYYEGLTQEVINFKNNCCCYGYDGKDSAIIAAINIINKHPLMGVNYYVKNNNNNVIVYFNFKINNRRLQVSFHSFSSKLRKLIGKGSPCRWEKKISSRETCQLLLRLCGEESEVKTI